MKYRLICLLSTLLLLSNSVPVFAKAEDAYFFGGNDPNEEINTRVELENTSAWLKEYGFNVPGLFLNPTIEEYSDANLNSGFLYIAGHGMYDGISTGHGCGITTQTNKPSHKNISNTNFSNSQCVILSACSTGALVGNQYVGLGTTFIDNGANFVLGWCKDIDSGTVGLFSDEFAKNLCVNKKTYIDAYISTKNYMLNEYSQITSDNNIWKTYMLGDINDTLQKPSNIKSSNLKKQSDNITVDDFLLDSLEQHIITEPIEYQQGRYDELESYIKKFIDSKFNLDDYVVRENHMTNTVDLVEFKYVFNNLETNYGFTVIYIDGLATIITFTKDHDKVDLDKLVLSSYTLNISDDDFYKKAIAEDNVENAIVKEQQLETRFDASSCKVFHIVNTVYEDSEGYRFATSHIY